jgi:elongation factor Ts
MMESIKKLRESTGAGMMDVKKALTDAGGNEEQAVALLRERGIVKAAKKADREATEGLVRALVASDGSVAALVEVNSETDFVARNEGFQALVAGFAAHVVGTSQGDGVLDIEALKAETMSDGSSVGDTLAAAVGKIGENLILSRAARFVNAGGVVVAYVHSNNKIGVLVELAGSSDQALAKDIALHIAAERTRYLDRSEVDSSDIEKEREILTNKAINEGKPQNIVEKIVAGQISKFYEETVLLEQKFVKDNTVTVASLLGSATVRRFVRFEIGSK